MNYHLAQANAAIVKAAFDDPSMSGLTSQIDAVNALAEQHAGFVWRKKDVTGDELALVADYLGNVPTSRVFFNMSVWTDVASLKAFTYETAHKHVFQQRQDWLQASGVPSYVLWWVPAQEHPSVAAAVEMFRHLNAGGQGGPAFTFANIAAHP